MSVNIDGSLLTQVSEFMYLGVNFNEMMNLNRTQSKILISGKNALYRCKHLIRNFPPGAPYAVA